MAQPTYEQLLDIVAEKDRQIAQLEARVSMGKRLPCDSDGPAPAVS